MIGTDNDKPPQDMFRGGNPGTGSGAWHAVAYCAYLSLEPKRTSV